MDYPSAFLEYMRHELNRSAATTDAYMTDIRQFEEFIGRECEHPDLTAATPDDINSWLATISSAGMSIPTLRRKLQSLRSFYRFLVRRHHLKTSPAADIEISRGPQPLPVYVGDDDMRRVFGEQEDDGSLDGLRNRLILEILYCMGIRRAELIELNDKDIDFDRGNITITGKRGKQRVLPAPREITEMISRYMHMRDEAMPDRTGGALFVGRHGDRMRPGAIQSLVNRTLASVDIERRSPHVLRHSFATSMLRNGADINSLRELMGHSRLSTTQIYTHLTDRDLRENYDAAHPRARRRGKDGEGADGIDFGADVKKN